VKKIGQLIPLEAIDVVLEATTWLSAWLIVPAYLAASTSSFGTFVWYTFGAAFLVGVGVLATSDRPHVGIMDLAIDYLRCWLALFGSGSIVFGATSLLRANT